MNANEYLALYAEGWTKGDVSIILNAVTDDFIYDEPNLGVITKSNFSNYMHEFKNTIKQHCDGNFPDPFMKLSEVVTEEGAELNTAWCWWEVPGTDIKGSGLIKFGSSGVKSELIAYYAKLSI